MITISKDESVLIKTAMDLYFNKAATTEEKYSAVMHMFRIPVIIMRMHNATSDELRESFDDVLEQVFSVDDEKFEAVFEDAVDRVVRAVCERDGDA